MFCSEITVVVRGITSFLEVKSHSGSSHPENHFSMLILILSPGMPNAKSKLKMIEFQVDKTGQVCNYFYRNI